MCSHLIGDLRAPRSMCKFPQLLLNLCYFLLGETLRHPLPIHCILTTLLPSAALSRLRCSSLRSRPSIIIFQYSAHVAIRHRLLKRITFLHRLVSSDWSKLQVLHVILTIHLLQLLLDLMHFIALCLVSLLALTHRWRQVGCTSVRGSKSLWLELLGCFLLFGFCGLHVLKLLNCQTYKNECQNNF